MSRSRRIFDLIYPRVPGTVVAGNFLLIMPTGYIARGFFLGATGRKDQMKLYRVVMPLYGPSEQLSLTHSKIIPAARAGFFHIDLKACAASAAAVLESVAPHVEALRQLKGPAEFLSSISWMAGNRMLPIRLDFGLTHYLLGDFQQSRDIFARMDSDLQNYPGITRDRYGPWVRQILELLRDDPAALRPVLDGWRDRKMEMLGISARAIS